MSKLLIRIISGSFIIAGLIQLLVSVIGIAICKTYFSSSCVVSYLLLVISIIFIISGRKLLFKNKQKEIVIFNSIIAIGILAYTFYINTGLPSSEVLILFLLPEYIIIISSLILLVHISKIKK